MSATANGLIDLFLGSLLRESTEDTSKSSSITIDPSNSINAEILNRLLLIYRLCIAKNNIDHPATSDKLNYPFYAKIFILHELQKFGVIEINRLLAKPEKCDLNISASCFKEIARLCVSIKSKKFDDIPVKGRAVRLVHSINALKLHFEAGTYCLLSDEVDTISPHVEYPVFLITKNNHSFASIGLAGASITF